MARLFLTLASFSGFIAVALGAFGAHGLRGRLDEALLSTYQTGVEYQFIHTLALLAVALLLYRTPDSSSLKVSGWAFVIGIGLFSGSLYALAFGAPSWVGPITPVGGLSFMVGWLSLCWSARQIQS
ncbi:MAG: DUF423 domain-containing protein [Candidatus Pelagadaptatus aseana]|uniref:DUF423 domain-containing protein n=1 Tax=Candidatus Pelagadaptatus aseana TaxID=3120508 RepID=UPI0039B244C5